MAGEKENTMKRRILAWILLGGFIANIVNLVFFRFLWEVSLSIYIIVIVYFLFSMGKKSS